MLGFLNLAFADLAKNANTKKGLVSKKSTKHVFTNNSIVAAQINSEADKKNAEVISSFLNSRKLGVTDNTNSFDVLSGAVLKGYVLNSIVSSNLESPILVLVTQSNCDIPTNSKFICTGATRGKRVLSACTKLIVNSDEFAINALLLNNDGTAGLTGVVFTGKEELVMGAMAAGAIGSVLDVSRDRIATPTGDMATNTARNKVITGAMGGLDEAVSIMGDEAKTKETKISIEAGTEVLIYINQRFKI